MHQPTDPHQHSEDHTRSPEARAALIQEGLCEWDVLPPYTRLLELDKALRAELAVVTPIVQRQADGMQRDDPGRYERQRAVDAAAVAVADDLGSGLVSAASHVVQLARRLRALDGYATGART